MTEQPNDQTIVASRQTMSGLEYFRLMADGKIEPPAMVSLLGLRLVEVEHGRIVFTGTATEQFYNGLGVAHGGFAATMLDSALGCAINSVQPAGRLFTTLELKINYTRPLTRATGEVRCEATVLHSGSRTATAEARIVDAEGRLYAHATTTCIVV
jgi:uncharacterized protein (TIGR00369 family)